MHRLNRPIRSAGLAPLKSLGFFALALLFVLLPALCAVSGAAAERNPKWAEPIELEGAPNLHKVDENFYRSAQPTAEGMKNLEKMGIKTVVNLRSYNSDKDEIKGTSLREIRVKMHAWDPEFDELVRILRILVDESGAPYLLHCQHGADRTGMTVAMYRMAVQGWPREEAIEEMLDGGYGFHTIWTGIVRFLETVDIEKFRRAIL